jgi:CRISPR-associated protein Cmr4
MKNLSNILTFYAVSPIHAGAESSTGAIDNPIQREVHTNYPHIQANGVKGAMRDFFRNQNKERELESLIFGDDKYIDPDEEDGDKKQKACPGAIAVSDAKLFAMPVRSNIAPFVWVTSPKILKRLRDDLKLCEIDKLKDISEIQDDNSILFNWETQEEKIILEDIVVNRGPKVDLNDIKELFPQADKLMLVSNDTFKYVVDNCTEIQTQIKIKEETGTAEERALRYEELLPSDSILYSVIYYGDAVFKKTQSREDLKMETIKGLIESTFNSFMQIGGDRTLGRGIVKLDWINREAKNE